MRAAPALQVTVHRFGAWRAAIALLCAAAGATLAAWLGSAAWAAAAAPLAALASWPATRRTPTRLSWNGRQWRVGTDDAPPVSPRVMIDLGSFLLVRLDGGAGSRWLPLQRRGLQASWHGLRCALYSAPPAASAPPDDPSSSP